jgi:hypothetical protein
MKINFTPEQDAFRLEIRLWLEQNVPSKTLASLDTKEGFEQHRDGKKN